MNTVFVQFCQPDGILTGPPLAIATETSKDQLEIVLNQLLTQEEIVPYSFFVDSVEILSTIKEDILDKHKTSQETVIQIQYLPQAVFRVRPISRCASSLSGHTDTIVCLAFSPDGKRLASGSGDCSVRFWDLNTDTPLPCVPVHKKYVICVAWSPDGKYLASGSADNTIQIWDGITTKPLGKPLQGHSDRIISLAWEPCHLAYPCVRLVSGSKDGTAKVWDVIRKTCLTTLSQHTDAISCVKWGGDGTIYSASRDRTIRLWNDKGQLLAILEGHGHWINTLALSSDYILRTGPFSHEGEISGSDPKASALARYKEFCGDEPERLVSGSDDFTMYLWCYARGSKPIARLTGHQGLIFNVCFSPDGRYIASASADKSVKLWNGQLGQFICSMRGHVGAVYQVCWSADSRLVMSCSKDSTVKIWELKSRSLKADLPGHFDEVYSVDWSPTGQRAATGGKDKLLKLWRQ